MANEAPPSYHEIHGTPGTSTTQRSTGVVSQGQSGLSSTSQQGSNTTRQGPIASTVSVATPQGPGMIPVATAQGPGMIPVATPQGPGIVPAATPQGPRMIPAASPQGPHMIPVATAQGPGMIPVATAQGPGMIPVATPQGPGIVPAATPQGPHMVPMATPQGPGMMTMPGQPMTYMQPYYPNMMPYPYIPAPTLPPEFVPNDYLIMTIILTIAFGFFQITSLMFFIPALVGSMMAIQKKNNGIQFYVEAKRFGYAALILDVVGIVWVILTAISIIIGIMVPVYTSNY